MSRFQIVPSDRRMHSQAVSVRSAESILFEMELHGFDSVDVFRNAAYHFSVCAGPRGMWYIFQRNGRT